LLQGAWRLAGQPDPVTNNTEPISGAFTNYSQTQNKKVRHHPPATTHISVRQDHTTSSKINLSSSGLSHAQLWSATRHCAPGFMTPNKEGSLTVLIISKLIVNLLAQYTSFGLYLTENTHSLNYKQPNHVLWGNNHKLFGQNSEIFLSQRV